jgi:rhodanese-related sulfurtransferase
MVHVNTSSVPTVSVDAVPADARPVDVREPEEWVAGRAPTAIHLPMSQITTRLGELPEGEDPLYVVCRVGGRSARVVQYLVAQGYPAVNVDGGMLAWAAAGRPLVNDGSGQPEIV